MPVMEQGREEMLDTTRCALGLLEEVGAVCDRLGISWVCGGVVPKIVHDGRFEDFDSAAVLVAAGDMPTLLDFLLSHPREGRAIEYYGNNPRYPDLSIRYADTATVLYDCGRNSRFDNNCIHVTVVPVRACAKVGRMAELHAKACTMRDITAENIESARSRKRKLKLQALRTLQRVYGASGESSRDAFFRKLCASYAAGSGGGSAWAKYDKGSESYVDAKLRADVLDDTVQHDLAGTSVRLPANLGAYYKGLYPVKGGGRTFPARRGIYTVADAHLPFEKMKQHQLAGEDVSGDIERDLETMRAMRKRVKARAGVTDAVWSLAKELYSTDGEGE